ncbi:metallophosphoesterase [Myxococcaceae bacterium GXIMD 01537]
MGIPLRFLVFFALLSTVTVLGHIYMYRRLFQDTSGSAGWRRAGVVLMTVLALLMIGSRLFARLLPVSAGIVATVAWSWMGIATYLVLALLTLGGARRAAGWLERRRAREPVPPESPPAPEPAPVSVERRQFLARATAGGALLAAGGLSTYGVWRAFHPPVVNEVAVRLPGLPKALDGLTVVQLSDIHVGPLIQRRFMDALVERCNALRPDVVCITGDLVDGSVAELGSSVAALSNLRTRFGRYFVTGNHEYYSGDEAWSEALESMGVSVLRNRHVRVGDASASFDLVGVDDWSARASGYARGYDLQAALAGRDPERASVLLAHQPSNWREAAKAGMGLQLSGHTHGGQFFPFTLVVATVWEHDAGHFEEDGRHLYVSRGTGFWGPPVRVAAPPEIVKVTLLA